MRLARKGYKHSEETKRKISFSNKGKPKTEEHKKHLSESKIGIKIPIEKHRHLSEKEKEKLRKNHSKPVQCVETGIIYSSAKEACLQLGLKSNHINDCINNPSRYKTAGGYH